MVFRKVGYLPEQKSLCIKLFISFGAALMLLGSVVVQALMFIPHVYGDSLPSGTNVSTGPYPRGGEIHVVELSDPGLLNNSFPDPSGPLYRLFSTVTGGVYGAVLHFDSDGVSYSIDVSPGSNTLMSFSHPIAITN